MNTKLEQLLSLQEKDLIRIDTELHLKHVPEELKILEGKLAHEWAAFDEEKKAYQKLEVDRKDLDNRLKTAEERLVQCKTKQAMVKKEDEYNALTVEIETLTIQSGDLETEELELLMRLDDEKKMLGDKEAAYKKRESELQAEVKHVQEKKKTLEGKLKSLIDDCQALEDQVDPAFIEAYNDAKRRSKKGPFVVKLDDGRCGGCFLKVSNEIAKAARDSGEPHNCDNCGRLVYV